MILITTCKRGKSILPIFIDDEIEAYRLNNMEKITHATIEKLTQVLLLLIQDFFSPIKCRYLTFTDLHYYWTDSPWEVLFFPRKKGSIVSIFLVSSCFLIWSKIHNRVSYICLQVWIYIPTLKCHRSVFFRYCLTDSTCEVFINLWAQFQSGLSPPWKSTVRNGVRQDKKGIDTRRLNRLHVIWVPKGMYQIRTWLTNIQIWNRVRNLR